MPTSELHYWIALNFKKRLQSLRKEQGLTQQGLADLVGVHITQIQRYENGNTQPTLDVIRKLSIALQISADMLIFEDGERGPSDDFRFQFEALASLSEDEQRTVKEVLDSLIIKYQARRLDSTRSAVNQ